jgi:hypothetical protein
MIAEKSIFCHLFGHIFYFFRGLHAKMGKKLFSMNKEQNLSREETLSRMKKALKDQCACYVLITCTAPAADGKMEVEMDFEGDEDLAALLIENASQVFDARVPRRESK